MYSTGSVLNLNLTVVFPSPQVRLLSLHQAFLRRQWEARKDDIAAPVEGDVRRQEGGANSGHRHRVLGLSRSEEVPQRQEKACQVPGMGLRWAGQFNT